ncbi:MAG TPA: efflux RND transporter periplasmic adaptor subunit [Alphaproteobacteria bacterium]|nr:efflux RND transporter periplasmic adaptor subunit [Alphaproteobacteria bacterium]
MNDTTTGLQREGRPEAPESKPRPSPSQEIEQSTKAEHRQRGGFGRWLFGLGILAVLLGSLGFAVWRHYVQHRQTVATTEQRVNFVPSVRVGEVQSREGPVLEILPGTTQAFEAANIYARASGYIEKRYVDIGDHVKAGQLLADITAPELDHQIAQAEANLLQAEATLKQNESNRELARVTTVRSARLTEQGWVTREQGDTDRLTYEAQQHATQAAAANIAAMQSQLMVLHQEKAYQQVVAPFDGVITQRNIDVGSLVTADTASSTPMFAMTQSDVIRVWSYVPQDAAFGVSPGVSAIIHVPEMPDRAFPGKVTRIASALQPDTRTLLTEIDVPNPDGALSPGIYCSVTLQIPRRTPALIIPASAIIFDRNGLQVAVVEDGVAHIRKITVVRDFGTEVEADKGVADGDKVILSPPVDLAEGEKVEIRADRNQSAP